jgi:predicted nucleic acid-binding protein
VTLYLDTSSLVKLYVTAPGSEQVRAQIDRATIVATSMLAYPEARAALARCRRERALLPAPFAAVKRKFEDDWPKYFAVHVTGAICREAGNLAERYALRGCDSVHLASFLALARQAGAADTEFSSADARLNRAARLAARAHRRR